MIPRHDQHRLCNPVQEAACLDEFVHSRALGQISAENYQVGVLVTDLVNQCVSDSMIVAPEVKIGNMCDQAHCRLTRESRAQGFAPDQTEHIRADWPV